MKKATKNWFVLGVLFSLSVSAFAQQMRQTNLYEHNKYSINPAYAGLSGCTEINFSHMNQWVRVDGAPLTNYLNFNTRVGKRLGIGGDILLDQLGMLRQFAASGGVSYGFTIKNQHIIRFGGAFGYFQLRSDPTGAIAFDNGDELIENGISSASTFNSELGILYKFKGLELSFVSKQFIENHAGSAIDQLDGFGLKRHFMAYGGYNFVLSKTISLKPNVFYRGINTVQQFDANVDFNYNDFIHAGIGYRTQVGLIGRLGVTIRKMFFVGYSYEAPMINVASYGSGSHEVMVGLKLCKKSKGIVPPPLADNIQPDTVTVVEKIMDTLVVETVDTVFIEKNPQGEVSNDQIRRAMLSASENLEFKHDQSIIEKHSYASLEALTNLLLIRENVRIRLEGHTDSDGTEDYNMRLSENRVEAVKRFLVANGIDKKRIETNYFGESKPIATNASEEGKAKNRRVEMIVLSEEKK